MYEDLTALVDQGLTQVLDRQDEILDALRTGNGQVNGNGNGQVNGNGNGQVNGDGNGQVNGNGNGLANGNGNGLANGNGNGLANGNGLSTEPIGVVQPPPEEPPNYSCDGCTADGKTTHLTPGQPYCPGCGDEMKWNGVAVPLDLDKSGL
jgi:hypothetical protein